MVKKSSQPMDRLTRICDAMTDTFDAHPESQEKDKCIVFLSDDVTGGIVLHGYDDPKEALGELFGHLVAMFQAMGLKLELIAIPDDVSGAE